MCVLHSAPTYRKPLFYLYLQGEISYDGYYKQSYAPGFKIIGSAVHVAQLYHDGSDGKSYSIVYINLDLNVRRK